MYFTYEGTNKINRGERNPYDTLSSFQYLKYGEVVSNTDEFGIGRIKVRIKGSLSAGGDDGILDSDLPFAFPMIPKHIQTVPKIGESVWIFVFDKNRQHADRLYIGPIISQPNRLNKDNGRTTALAGFTFGPIGPNVNPSTIPQVRGVFPDLEDISIQGRYNTDITQKNNQIIIRAGKFEEISPNTNNPFPFQFNKKTQAFIQIKNDVQLERPTTENTNTTKGSVTTIVANKINLITHKDGSPRFNVLGQDELINDDEMQKILNEAHQLPFGDVLIEYLRLLKDAFLAHVHNGSGNPPTDLTASGNKLAVASFKSRAEELEKSMLSKNIRIN
jgi:hypothetical protein